MNVAILLGTLIASAIETSRAVATLNRGTSPWTEERVKALVENGTISATMLPDMRAVKPTDIHIDPVQLEWGREMLRFSNSIANTGANNLQVRLGDLITNPDQTQIEYYESLGLDVNSVRLASQELLDVNGNNVAVIIPDTMLSNYHHSHNHLHITETTKFSIEHFDNSTNSWSVVSGRTALKQYFCLMDTDRIRPVLNTADPDDYESFYDYDYNGTSYQSCDLYQEVSAGALDFYGADLPGQEVSICGLPGGIYRIVVTLNPSGWFLESNYSNNVGWASFKLERDEVGTPTVSETSDSVGGIRFNGYNPYPTTSPYPTPNPYPTPSPYPTTSQLCTGNTPNWSIYGVFGCNWFEVNDLPGCPYNGDFSNGGMGSAKDNCCYCSSTFSMSPSESSSPTTTTRSPNKSVPTYPPFPTFPPVPTASPYPTYSRTKSPSPTTTSRPSMCTDNTPNWVNSWGAGCVKLEYDNPSCERGYMDIGAMGPAAEHCCYCLGKLEVCSAKSPTDKPTQKVSFF